MKTALRAQAIDVAGDAERLLEKLRFSVHIGHNQIRRDSSEACTDGIDVLLCWFRCCTHSSFLFKFSSETLSKFEARQFAQLDRDAEQISNSLIHAGR